MSKEIDLARLRAPFPPEDIEWRVGVAGRNHRGIWCKVLAYVTARAIQNRLDEVCGAQNWWNEKPEPGPQGGVLQGISIEVSRGKVVTKWDGAENTEFEAVKGGLSDAMKRAAVQWGIGRYLYDLEETFANVHDQGKHFGRYKIREDGRDTWIDFRWDPPQLPAWAVPQPQSQPSAEKMAESEAAAPVAQSEPKAAERPNDRLAYSNVFRPEVANHIAMNADVWPGGLQSAKAWFLKEGRAHLDEADLKDWNDVAKAGMEKLGRLIDAIKKETERRKADKGSRRRAKAATAA